MGTNFDAIKLAVEGATGGKNTVLFDDLGNPSIMVRIPKFKICDVITCLDCKIFCGERSGGLSS